MSIQFPTVPWSQFTSGFKWSQGDHLLAVGETKSGKTTLLSQIVPYRRFVVVFVTKSYDETFNNKKLWPGFTILREWNNRKAYNAEKVLLWPRPGKTIDETVALQETVFRKAMNDIYLERGWCVVVDEAQWCVDMLHLSTYLKTYQHQARSSGITNALGFQRPSGIPVVAYGGSTHAFISRQVEDDDVKRLAGLGGIDAKVLRATLPQIPQHHWLYLNKLASTGPILTKVEIRE